MLIGAGGDLHARPEDNNEKVKAMDWALGRAKALGCKWFLHSGDWFHTERIGDRYTTAQEVVAPYLEMINRHQLPILAVRGNHDLTAITTLASSPWVRVVTSPGWYTLDDNTHVLAWPWGTARDPWGPVDKLWGYVENLMVRAPKGPKIFLGHLGIQGHVCPNGEAYPEDRVSCLTRSQAQVLRDNVQMVLGHVHVADEYYCGTLSRSDHGEERVPEGFWVLDTDRATRTYEEYTSGPRWITLKPEEFDPAQFTPRDRIRVLGGGIQLIKLRAEFPWLTSQTERQAMVERRFVDQENLTSLKISEVAKLWSQTTQCPPPDQETFQVMEEMASRLETAQQIDSDFQAIEWIESVRLINQGRRHVDTLVEFPEDRLTAICGQIGTGKSFVIEALYCALWGAWTTPSRSMENVSSKDLPKGQVRVTFRTAADRYVVTREKGYLSIEKNGTLQTDNKVNSGENWLARYFPRDSVRDVLVAQRGGGMVDETEGKRMAYMARVLRLGVWDEMLECAQAMQKQFAAVVHEAAMVPEWTAKTKTLRDETAILDQQLQGAIAHLAPIEVRRQQLQAILSQQERLRDLEAQVSLALAWLEQAHQENLAMDNLAKELAREERFLADLEPVIPRVRELAEKQTELQRVRMQINTLAPLTGAWDRAGCRANPLPCVLIDNARQASVQLETAQTQATQLQREIETCLHELTPRLSGLATMAPASLSQGPAAVLQTWDQLTRAHEHKIGELNSRRLRLAQEQQIREQKLADVRAEVALLTGQGNSHAGIQDEARALEGQVMSLREQIKFQEYQKNQNLRTAQDFDQRIARVEQSLRHVERLKWIERASTRAGVRQMLIEAALPSLQEILNRLCGGPMKGQFWITVSTQKELATGDQKESFQILFEQDGISHDAAACSGGQLAQVRAIWAAAMLMWAQRQRTHRILLLDEPTAAQDEESQDLFMRLLETEVEASQILIVTHSAGVADRCQGKVFAGGK